MPGEVDHVACPVAWDWADDAVGVNLFQMLLQLTGQYEEFTEQYEE
jgi:hypothetical protein